MEAWVALLGYVMGSIPFGVVITRLAGAGDLRQIGSGNIGATNVLRTGRKGLAVATLLLDIAKGALAVCIGAYLLPGAGFAGGAAIAGAMAFIGHCFPVWLRFAGGKGVATMMGVVLALAWPVGLCFALVWIGVLLASRISSAGGISAAISAPLAAWALGYELLLLPIAMMGAIVVWRHKENIARLIAGTEPRISGKKSA